MTLKQWSDNGWLRPHKTTPEEIENLFQIVDRDLKDAGSELSADWRFGIAYNAALKLCMILLYSEGYEAERNRDDAIYYLERGNKFESIFSGENRLRPILTSFSATRLYHISIIKLDQFSGGRSGVVQPKARSSRIS